ncbi:MAG: PA14 domain-containing protein, partial [Verrucomicrobiota bacterium]
VFDFRTNQWNRVDDGNDRRWYTTSVALPDGDVFTVAGNGGPNTAERYDRENDQWNRLTGIDWQPISGDASFESQWWAYVFVAPNGQLFHFGPTETMHWVDPDGNGSRTSAGLTVPGSHYPKHAGVVMYESGKFLVAGGAANAAGGGSGTSGGGTTTACYTVDLNTSPPTVALTGSMTHPRRFQNAVVLPTGEVLIAGGNTSGRKFSDLGTVLTPEIWNPQTGTWREVADMAVPRNYHSTGLLLPDGRAFIGGGGYASGNPNASFTHQDVELYTPPSLFNASGTLASRPSITSAPDHVTVGSVFNVSATSNLKKFAAIRMMATTHGLSTDQRYLSLPFSETSSGQYQLVAHPNINVMVPGYWMLFGLNANGAYSEASIIHVKEDGNGAISGLKGDYFDGTNFNTLKQTRIDDRIDFDFENEAAFPADTGNDTYSHRWTGWIVPDYSQTYTFYTSSDDGVRLWVNNQQLINNWTDHGPTEDSGTITLTAGQPVPVTLEHYEAGGGSLITLSWSSPSVPKQFIPERNLRHTNPNGSATLSVDDIFELYVDGALVAVGTEWDKTYRASFSTGAATTIAIRACNTGGAAHVLGEFMINGERIGTSTQWKVSGTEQAGWNQPGFNDNAWGNAVLSGNYTPEGMPPNSPAQNIWSSNSSDDEIFLRFDLGLLIADPTDRADVENDAVSFGVQLESGGGGVSYSASNLPNGISINSTSGVISGTLTNNSAGSYNVTVTASQGGNSTSASFLWEVVSNESGKSEVGSTRVSQSGSTQWHTVNLQHSYTAPVVVMGPPSYFGSHPSTMRVRNVTSTSFQFQIDEWDYLDGIHGPQTIQWLALEAGTHEIGGRTVAAGSGEATG